MELLLPAKSNESELVDVLNQMVEDSKTARAPQAIQWYINYHYLRGARYFSHMDYQTGDVEAFYEDISGQMPFRYEEILAKYQAEVGRLQQLDIAPYVERGHLGLEYAKKAATAHVILDTLMRSQDLDSIKLMVAQNLCLFGTVGLTNWTVAVGEKQHIIDVVPPWELFPLPGTAVCTAKAPAICRERWVPLKWLKSMSAGEAGNLKVPKASDRKLDIHQATPGYPSEDGHPDPLLGSAPGPNPSSPGQGTTGTNTYGGGSGDRGTTDKRQIPHVRLRETWVNGPGTRLSRYIIQAGDRIVYDQSYSPEKREGEFEAPIRPISISTYIGGVGFYGRAFVDGLVSLNAEVESAILSLLRNVQDIDQMGYLFYPSSWGIPRDAIENSKPGRRVMEYEPDPAAPQIGIQSLQPVNSGTLPGQTANLGISLMDRMSGQPSELMSGQAPGRTEAGIALNTLFQASNIPLGGVATSIASAFGHLYKSILWSTRGWSTLRVNVLSLLDDMVAGIVIDPESGSINLAKNKVPDPDELVISIRSKEPTDIQSQKEELLLMMKEGVITKREFRIINRREAIGLPTGNDVEWQNYVRAVINSILLFNDGVEPGRQFTSDYDIPWVHEYVVLRRMSSPEFAHASADVQTAFRNYLLELRAQRGGMPQDMPYIEEAAEMAAFQMQDQLPAEAAGGIPLDQMLTEGAPGPGTQRPRGGGPPVDSGNQMVAPPGTEELIAMARGAT